MYYDGTKERLLMPNNLLECVFHSKHYNQYSRHAPLTTILADLTRKYYHPNLRLLIQRKTQQCPICKSQKKSKLPRIEYGLKRYAQTPRTDWSFDVLGGLKPAHTGHKYIIVITDNFTLFTYLHACKTKETSEVIRAFRTYAVFLILHETSTEIKTRACSPTPFWTSANNAK